jgi:hypothetical protein
MEIRSHIFLNTALEVNGYIHVPTVLPIEKAAVYKTRENVPQGKSADKKEKKRPIASGPEPAVAMLVILLLDGVQKLEF